MKLHALFSDGMVVQRDIAAPVWGTGTPGETVTVAVDHQQHTAVVDKDGNWQIRLKPLSAGGPLTLTVKGGDHEVVIRDVLVGEVWICSGQSNMEWPLILSDGGEAAVAGAENAGIRLYRVPQQVGIRPVKLEASWQACTPHYAESFSAVGYYFGRYLHQALDVPIGLIHTNWGGTPAEAWTPLEALRRHEILQPIVERALPVYESTDDVSQRCDVGGALYNGMIEPLIPYAIRGALWYQGESNVDRAYQYRTLLTTLIESWREVWGQGEFPFLIVQLANFYPVEPLPVENDWAELREAQSMALRLPNTGLAVAIDVGDALDIHPTDKKTVGKRLALSALGTVYGQDIAHSGPQLESSMREGGAIRLGFGHAETGLVARGETLQGFAIAGADRHFVWADAKIDGSSVVVRSAAVAEPVAVRYAWAANPICNLYNGAGLPASPFRTDDWPGITEGNL